MPLTSRDFQKAALQRLTTAEFLLQNTYNLDAMYPRGYTIECSLKALILELTAEPAKIEVLSRITSGGSMHRPEVLLGILRDMGQVLPGDLRKRFRSRHALEWSPALRDESGRTDTGETRAFLRLARAVHDWVDGRIL